jgi:hypothetical protein
MQTLDVISVLSSKYITVYGCSAALVVSRVACLGRPVQVAHVTLQGANVYANEVVVKLVTCRISRDVVTVRWLNT